MRSAIWLYTRDGPEQLMSNGVRSSRAKFRLKLRLNVALGNFFPL